MDASGRSLNLKLTAITYCKLGAAKHLRETGRLPANCDPAWSVVLMRNPVDPNYDPVLSAEELAVYDAILRERSEGRRQWNAPGLEPGSLR